MLFFDENENWTFLKKKKKQTFSSKMMHVLICILSHNIYKSSRSYNLERTIILHVRRIMEAWIPRGRIIRPAAEVRTRTMRSTSTTVKRNNRPVHWVTRPPYRWPQSWYRITAAAVTITLSRGRCTGQLQRRPMAAAAAAGTCTIVHHRHPRTTTTGPPARTRCPGPRSSHHTTTATTRTGRPTGHRTDRRHRTTSNSNPAVPATNSNRTFTSCRPSGSTLAKWSGCTWTTTLTQENDRLNPTPLPGFLLLFNF